jgi:hypothetical protein
VFSPDGRLVAPSVSPQQIRLAETATARTIAHLSTLQPLGATPLALSPDGTRLIAAINRLTALIWDLRRIRQHLGAMDLDWDQPPFPEAEAAASTPPPIRSIRVHRLGQPARARDAFDRAVHWLHDQKQLPAE